MGGLKQCTKIPISCLRILRAHSPPLYSYNIDTFPNLVMRYYHKKATVDVAAQVLRTAVHSMVRKLRALITYCFTWVPIFLLSISLLFSTLLCIVLITFITLYIHLPWTTKYKLLVQSQVVTKMAKLRPGIHPCWKACFNWWSAIKIRPVSDQKEVSPA